jgi:hypothetical protein
MTSADTPSSESSSSHEATQRFAAVRMPIEEPVEDITEAVEKLRACDSADLRRAREHHRRALESLENGGYSGLSDATREHLVGRLRTNLKALNQVLDVPSPDSPDCPSTAGDIDLAEDTTDRPDSFSARFRTFFQNLW